MKEAESLWHEVEKYYSKSMSIHNAKFADTYGVVLHKLGRFEESGKSLTRLFLGIQIRVPPIYTYFNLSKTRKNYQ